MLNETEKSIVDEDALLMSLFRDYRGEFILDEYKQDYYKLKSAKETGIDLDYTPVFNPFDVARRVLENELYLTRSYQ